jgi:predicted RNase H-like HicB family nuclease
MRYFISIELPADDKTAFGVVVPDIPGCFSAGDTLEEAIENAEEAILMQLEDMIDRGLDVPDPSAPDAVAEQFPGWALAAVEVDPRQLSKKAKRVNVTIPEGVLYLIDREAKKVHSNRSAFLTEAALMKIQN